MVATDGGIFNYGDAGFAGSAGGTTLYAPIIGMTSGPTGVRPQGGRGGPSGPAWRDDWGMTPPDDAGSELQRRNAVVALRKNLAAFEALQRELTSRRCLACPVGALEGDARLLDTLEAVRSHEIRRS